jgi:hypothetical protein
MNFTKKLFFASFFALVLGFYTLPVLAQTATSPNAPAQTTDQRCTSFINQFGLSKGTNIVTGYPVYCSATQLILKVIDYALGLSGVVSIVFLIVGGFMFMTSAGNEEQAEKGRKILINSVIGLAVIIMSTAIVTIVASALTLGK